MKLPFAQKIYIRPDWRDIQKRPGRLDLPEHWKITFDLARRDEKRVGFRVMLENPDMPHPRGDPSPRSPSFRQRLMNEADRGRAFADCRGHALHVPSADVADGEHAG